MNRLEFDADNNIIDIYNFIGEYKYELYCYGDYITGFATCRGMLEYIKQLDVFTVVKNNRVYLDFDIANQE